MPECRHPPRQVTTGATQAPPPPPPPLPVSAPPEFPQLTDHSCRPCHLTGKSAARLVITGTQHDSEHDGCVALSWVACSKYYVDHNTKMTSWVRPTWGPQGERYFAKRSKHAMSAAKRSDAQLHCSARNLCFVFQLRNSRIPAKANHFPQCDGHDI